MKTYPKSDPKMVPKSITNHSKINAKKDTKKEGLKPSNRWPARCGQSPNPIISKDILRSEVRRKYTKKVEWRVSAEWSAKSEMQRGSEKRQVQKASAERQVQTGNPLRTQTRSVVATTCGSMSYRIFRRPLGFVRLWFVRLGVMFYFC